MTFIPRRRWIRVVLLCVSVFFLLATFLVLRALRFDARAAERDMAAVARSHPDFTVQQRMGILRQITSALHPKGGDLSFDGLMKRFAKFLTATSSSLPPAANFAGNVTVVGVKDGDLLAMPQQPDCSLNVDDWAYTVNPSTLSFSYTLASSTPNVQLALHSAAGLTTSPGHYPVGCGNTSVGSTSRKVIFVGVTKSNIRVYAGHFYDAILGGDQVFAVTSQANDNFLATTKLNDPNNVADLATADLNDDGNGDLVAIDNSLTTGANATINVFLGKLDGSFSGPTQITLQGIIAGSAVIDDFNGDGIKDVVVSTSTFSTTGGPTAYTLNVLLGKGDGTFQPLQTYAETPPANIVSSPYFGLISADLRGSGHKDLISSAGVILFGKGDGTFAQSATVAFPSVTATSDSGPNVVAADFNKDGKPDLAVNNGVTTQVFLGKGDGTFTAKTAYSTIGNIGYLIAQDIDGDGNIDLYSGAGNNGSIGGDSFINNLGYALMGNGDGTFRGAPSEQFAYTGTNLGDLTGKGVLSAVAVTSNGSTSAFTSYLGNGKGNFTTGATLTVSPISIGGSLYQFDSGIDSFAVGDIDGDGLADLVYMGVNFYGPGFTPGIFVATGKGDGSFNAPVFEPTPAFIQSPDFDVNPTISGIRLADFNHDGKLDVVYTYSTTSYVTHTDFFGIAVQLGNGDGTFSSTAQLTQLYSGSTTPNPGAFQIGLVGKVNGDAFPDILVLSGLSQNAQGFTVQVFLGTGTGAFQAPKTVSGLSSGGTYYGTQWAPLVLADMNNDGAPDIVDLQSDPVTGDLQIAIALGNGDGTFRAPTLTTYASQYINGTSMAVGDFDGDGNMDVATSSFIGTSGSGIALGNGDGTLRTGGSASNLVPAQVLYVGGFGAAIAVDLNGDGLTDIFNGSSVLLNQGQVSGTTPAATTTTLVSSANPSAPGEQVTFTATVTSNGAGTPTGQVTFFDGGTSLGTVAVGAGGTATFTTSTLAVGAHAVTAQYGGDANFAASTSAAVAQTVNAAADFTVSANPTALTIVNGQSGTVEITVTPQNGSTQTVSFACAGLPAASTCVFMPTSVTLDGAHAAAEHVAISTTARSSLPVPAGKPLPPMFLIPLECLGFCLAGFFLLRRIQPEKRILRAALVLLLLAVPVSALISCGGSSGGGSTKGTPAGTSQVSITAASGSDSHAVSVAVTVN